MTAATGATPGFTLMMAVSAEHKGDGPMGPPFSLINDTLINDAPLVDSGPNIANLWMLIPLKVDGNFHWKWNEARHLTLMRRPQRPGYTQ